MILDDGGATAFCRVIRGKNQKGKAQTPQSKFLTPDFPAEKEGALENWWWKAKPDVFNHNPGNGCSNYLRLVRRWRALFPFHPGLLQRVKELDQKFFTKSGIMGWPW